MKKGNQLSGILLRILMAEAVEDIFPGVKFWVGPPIEKGFYYDIDLGDKRNY